MSKWKIGLVATGCFVTALAVAQNQPSPEQAAANYRKALMTMLAGNLQPIAAMGRDRAPFDASVVTKNAGRIAALGEMMTDAFQRDTSAATLQNNRAMPEIWRTKADFDRLAAEVRTKANAVLAAGNDETRVKAAINELGSTCGSCHDKYRTQ